MKFINIEIQCSWGIKQLIFPLNDLLELECHVIPGYLIIRFDRERYFEFDENDLVFNDFIRFLKNDEKVFKIAAQENEE